MEIMKLGKYNNLLVKYQGEIDYFHFEVIAFYILFEHLEYIRSNLINENFW